jgi:hypothetical protein
VPKWQDLRVFFILGKDRKSKRGSSLLFRSRLIPRFDETCRGLALNRNDLMPSVRSVLRVDVLAKAVILEIIGKLVAKLLRLI